MGGRAGKPLSNMALLELMRGMKPGFVPHGFRSTFRDWAAETTTFPSEVVEMALAHAIESKVEAAYRRGDLFREAPGADDGVGEFLHAASSRRERCRHASSCAWHESETAQTFLASLSEPRRCGRTVRSLLGRRMGRPHQLLPCAPHREHDRRIHIERQHPGRSMTISLLPSYQSEMVFKWRAGRKGCGGAGTSSQRCVGRRRRIRY